MPSTTSPAATPKLARAARKAAPEVACSRKTGGRKLGTPNKRTEARLAGIDALLQEYGYDPLRAMIEIACAPDTPREEPIALAKDVAPLRVPPTPGRGSAGEARTRGAV